MTRLVFVLALFIGFNSTQAMAQETTRDLVLVFLVGALPDNTEPEDVIEPLRFGLRQLPNTAFADTVRTQDYIPSFESNLKPGNCVFDTACLRLIKQNRGLRHFFLVTVTFVADQASVEIIKVTDSTLDDVIIEKKMPAKPGNIINFAAEAITELVKPPRPPVLARLEDVPVRTGRRDPVPSPLDLVLDPLPEPDLPKTLTITGWVTVGVGAILAGIGAYYQFEAVQLQSELSDKCSGAVCTLTRPEAYNLTTEIKDSGQLGNGLAITGWTLVVGGLATAITGHVLSTETESSVEVSPVFNNTGGMLFTTVRF